MPGSPNTNRIARTTKVGGLVAGQGAKLAGGRALDRLRSDDAKERAQIKRTGEIVEQIVVQLGSMKGAAMKVGQVLSTVELPGLDPESSERIQRRLAELRDSAPSVSFDKLEKLMVKEWGSPVRRVLRDIDPESMAAASIGQVHRAVTTEGEEVAVKVQYPGIAEAVDADLRNLGLLMPLLGRLAPGLDTKALAAELRERISEELDYELEASNQRRIARLWRGHPHVRIPGVDLERSTRRVLVTELHEGTRFDDLKAHPDAERDRVAEIVHRFYYATAGEHGIALGDPHPGNWQVGTDGRVTVFDFGMLRTLPSAYLRREGPVLEATQEQDAAKLHAAMADLGYLAPGADVDAFLLLTHMTVISGWLFADQPHRLSPEEQRAIGEELLALGPDWRTMIRQLSLPSEAVLLRRMADLLFVGFAQLRAAADWWALAEELLLGRPPRTPLGIEHAAWRNR
jgi:predicted unusual protein kinase regulating ubiquinone biosynthesis (AarF/ABC1/UbiB family)